MKKNLSTLVYSAIGLISVLLLISGWSIGFAGGMQYMSLSSVSIATVQSGDFTQRVTGYGILQSQNQRMITASSAATVDEIKLRPGAVVEPDSIILTLKNPTLEIAVQQAMANVHNKKTNGRKLSLEQQRELLDQRSRLSEFKSEAELAGLQVEAEAPLADAGIISAMDARRSRAKAEQLKERYQLEQQKFDTLQEVHQEHLLILQEEIQQAEAEFSNATYQQQLLVVRAGLAGVLQRLPVSLGQSVNIGEELALVGSLSPLIAEVKVPQMQVRLLQPGAGAEVDTRHGIVTGQVLRIDPVVVDGAVQVDILLPENLSADIRPMQMVDARIRGQSRGQVNFVDRPVGVAEDAEIELFKVDTFQVATKVPVQFGKASGQQIEVISGLAPGDRIIVSDLQIENSVAQLKLTQ
ncbi:HlyD family efflux transporter periplasmic adaptor subunit [Rheinheimera sp. 1928-s]|uniref:efflux RND transporter periplasmic adaptor subunit n=1 Tax=Rheinheimera sp. 1928-s TaxID=3033803 RepID=UPI0026057707|nr:HlyD family efflux transporter periplasmic adaptor subunit [Rheinheimera sp. 1928-s]MDF3125396.1 HlyD family efflux transporter periplasmic adaptor subunit [Rheinheimera sp. 1928-s]